MLAKLLKYWFPLVTLASMLIGGGAFSERLNEVERRAADLSTVKADAAPIQARQDADDKTEDEFRRDTGAALKSFAAELTQIGKDVAFIRGEMQRQSLSAQNSNENDQAH